VRLRVAAAAACLSAAALAHGAEAVKVYAAGSLRAPLTQAAAAFKAAHGAEVSFEFGASGLLRERLAKGEKADVFASANMEHPQSLSAAGLSGPVTLFARNRLCALAPAKLGVTTDNVLDRMLDPATRLGTSTPKADPSGDYAWEVFGRAEKVRPGSFATLSAKALQLTGGPNSPPPPKGRSVYAAAVAEGHADIFLTYCTNAKAAAREEPSLAVVALPDTVVVGADYGMTAMRDVSPQGEAFAEFLLGPEGRHALSEAGFALP